jgi:hypothetical protein
MRVQNEKVGKSSWWIMNPKATSPHKSRRRSTMDATTKVSLYQVKFLQLSFLDLYRQKAKRCEKAR